MHVKLDLVRVVRNEVATSDFASRIEPCGDALLSQLVIRRFREMSTRSCQRSASVQLLRACAVAARSADRGQGLRPHERQPEASPPRSVERLVGRFKEVRRFTTRYEKLAVNYVAVTHVTSIALFLGQLA